MIPTVQTVPSALTNVNRGNAQGVRGGAPQTATGSGSVRSVDRVGSGESVQVGLTNRQTAQSQTNRSELANLSNPTIAAGTGQLTGMKDPVQTQMELLAQKTALRADLAVFRTQDDMMGSLLNVMG